MVGGGFNRLNVEGGAAASAGRGRKESAGHEGQQHPATGASQKLPLARHSCATDFRNDRNHPREDRSTASLVSGFILTLTRARFKSKAFGNRIVPSPAGLVCESAVGALSLLADEHVREGWPVRPTAWRRRRT
jgi:hypothetical protein